MALYVCVIKSVHEQNKPALDENLKIIGAVVGPVSQQKKKGWKYKNECKYE